MLPASQRLRRHLCSSRTIDVDANFPALAQDLPNGITYPAVAARDVLRAKTIFENQLKVDKGAYALADHYNAFAKRISSALTDSAPLLLLKLKAAHEDPLRAGWH